MKKLQKFIDNLSPVKKRIARYLSIGLTPEETARKVSKENKAPKSNTQAFVTMVVNKAKELGVSLAPIGKKVVSNPKKSDYMGNGKQHVRAWVQKFVIETAEKFKVKKGVILTLSCFGCNAEVMINNVFDKFTFLSYELDNSNFKRLKDNIKKNKWGFMLPPVNAEILEGIIKAKKDTYAHLFLDFCRSLYTHGRDIEMALKKDIVQVNGIVWITVSVCRKKDYNTNTELMKLIQKAGGNRYELLDVPKHISNYRDGMPMVSIILRRVK